MKDEIKNCIICRKEIANNNGEICYSCLEFFRWKYGKKFRRAIEQYLNYNRNKPNGGKNMDSYKCSCGAYTTNEDGICDLCKIDYDNEETNEKEFE